MSMEELRRLAKEATNGWACFAKRNCEHDEITRLHKAIDAAEPVVPISQLRALSEQWKRDAHENRRHGELYVAHAYTDCAADLDRLLLGAPTSSPAPPPRPK